MLGTARLLTFLFRALVLLVPVSVIWVNLAGRYNQALVSLAGPILPADVGARALGSNVIFEGPRFASSISIEGFTLHYGLVLMIVLVLASVGLGVGQRVVWLLVLGAVAFAMHVTAVGLLGRGLVWAAGTSSPDSSDRLVLSLFAVFWGLLPALIGGAWCIRYWIPRVSRGPAESPGGRPLSDVPPTSI